MREAFYIICTIIVCIAVICFFYRYGGYLDEDLERAKNAMQRINDKQQRQNEAITTIEHGIERARVHSDILENRERADNERIERMQDLIRDVEKNNPNC